MVCGPHLDDDEGQNRGVLGGGRERDGCGKGERKIKGGLVAMVRQ